MWKFRGYFLCLAPPLLVYFGVKALLCCDWLIWDYVAATVLTGISLAQWIPLEKGENFWTQGKIKAAVRRGKIEKIPKKSALLSIT